MLCVFPKSKILSSLEEKLTEEPLTSYVYISANDIDENQTPSSHHGV